MSAAPHGGELPQAVRSGTAEGDQRTHVLGPSRQPPLPAPFVVLPGVGPGVEGVAHCVTLPGYQFLACLGHSDTTEAWVVRTPEDRVRQVKFVRGFRDAELQVWWERLICFRDGGLPALLPVELIRSDPGRVVLLSDVIERALGDRLNQCRRQRLVGIPRAELLDLLQPVAEVLDRLFHLFRVQHLNLSPKTLLLEGGRLWLTDVGLPQVTDAPDPSPARPALRGCSGHGAPEWVIRRQAAPTSDQYSLALIFAEMLTGAHPLAHLSRERATRNRQQWRPNLKLLPEADHEVLDRALHADPFQRFPTCAALLAALRDSSRRVEAERNAPANPLPTVIVAAVAAAVPASAPANVTVDKVVTGLVQRVAGREVVQEFRQIRYLLRPGELLQHRCAVRLFPGVPAVPLEDFCSRWRARPIARDERAATLRIPLRRDLWQFCLGRAAALEVEVRLLRPAQEQARWAEVGVRMRPLGCGPRQAAEVLNTVAPLVLESLRQFLPVTPEMRTQERLLCEQPLRVAPVFAGQKLGGPIECQGKDISLHGIGFYLPQQLPGPQLYVQVPPSAAPEVADLALLARVVRAKPLAEGWYEVGARFVPPAAP